MAHIFLDESGQFSKSKGEKYFVIGSFTIGEPRRIEKKFKSLQRNKFPRKMCLQPEIKFSDVKISDNLRLKTIRAISYLDIRIRYAYLLKKNIPTDYIKKGKLQSGDLYVNIIGETIEMYLPNADGEFRVFCDQRHLKGITRSEFKRVLTARLLPKLPKKTVLQIEMLDSKNSPCIQIADWIAGALASYLENKKLGKDFYEILKNNILSNGSKELFKNGNGGL